MVMKHHYTTLLTFNDVLRGKIHTNKGQRQRSRSAIAIRQILL